MRESFSQSSGPGRPPEVRLRMQVKPEEATGSLFSHRGHCTMRLSVGVSSEKESNTLTPTERRHPSRHHSARKKNRAAPVGITDWGSDQNWRKGMKERERGEWRQD
jgi:hypothetical protein